MVQLEAALDYMRATRQTQLEVLCQFLRIPSVSTLPEHKPDIRRAAEWLAGELRSVGMTRVEIMSTAGHPVVYADWLEAAGKPTALVYGHYDVQPADPLADWLSPPFEPTLCADNLFARGASDMKSQAVAQLKATEAFARTGGIPVNLKYLFEGEEEIGSPNLGRFIDEHRELLKCDFVLNCDSGIQRPDLPTIVYGLRGLAYFEIEVRGPKNDLHSGVFGGVVHNPAAVLCKLIAEMHDENWRVTLPGFYDDVRPLSDEECRELGRFPCSEEDWKSITGAPALRGEEGYTPIERVGARPTLEVNGIVSGFTGEGSKTVLPAKAKAKISMRLVPDQDESNVYGQLCSYMKAHAPDTVTWEVRELARCPAAIVTRNSPYMRAAAQALRSVFGVDPIFKREGGSVPVVGMMQRKLGVDSVMLGFALPDDNIHGPNEKQYLPNFYRGIETHIRFLASL